MTSILPSPGTIGRATRDTAERPTHGLATDRRHVPAAMAPAADVASWFDGMPVWALAADADSLDADARGALAAELHRLLPGSPCLWLVTCHRVEVYGPAAFPPGRELVERPGVRLLHGTDAIRHLLRVAAGIESAVLGEDQVLAQLRSATAEFRARPETDPVLDRLGQVALSLGRRVRRGPRPHEHDLSDRAVVWLERRLGGLAGRRVLVVGAGVMGRSVAYVLGRRRATVVVATRTPRQLAGTPTVIDLRSGALRIGEFDAVVIALGGRWSDLTPELAAEAGSVVDLSSPGAVAPDSRARLANGLIEIDDLAIPAGHDDPFLSRAMAAVARAEDAFAAWLAARPSAASARLLTERTARRRDHRVERALRRLPELDARGREIVRQLVEQAEADLLHAPLQHLGSDRDGSAARAARLLFDL